MNPHIARSAGYSGLLFILLFIPIALAGGVPPDIGSSADTIGAWFDGHRQPLLITAWLTFIANALFLWFAVVLAGTLREAGTGGDDRLPLFAVVNALTAVVVAAIGGLVQAAMVFHPSAQLGPGVVRLAYDAYAVIGVLLDVPLAVFIFAVAQSGRRHASLPGWFNGLGYLVALLTALASLSLFFDSGPLALGGVAALLLGSVPFAAWMVAGSVLLIRYRTPVT